MFEGLYDAITNPAAIAVFIAFMGVLTALGKLFIKIGNTGKYAADNNDWFDSIGAFLTNLADTAGRAMAFLGIGNQAPKSPPKSPE